MSDLKELEARLRRLEDIKELEDLLARYSLTADLGRTEEYVDLFTEDGVMDLIDMGLARFEGREALREFINGSAAADAAHTALHIALPTVFYVDGDDATGEGYSVMQQRDLSDGFNEPGFTGVKVPIKVSVSHANYSHWTFRRVDGVWRIVERYIKLMASPEAPEIFRKSIKQQAG